MPDRHRAGSMSPEEREVAIEACRQWAQIRGSVLVAAEDTREAGDTSTVDAVEEFDKQMFRLGEKVWTNPT